MTNPVAWRTMDTAPKVNGEPILIWINSGPSVVSWSSRQNLWEMWLDGDAYALMDDPPEDTLWMPIPEKPS